MTEDSAPTTNITVAPGATRKTTRQRKAVSYADPLSDEFDDYDEPVHPVAKRAKVEKEDIQAVGTAWQATGDKVSKMPPLHLVVVHRRV